MQIIVRSQMHNLSRYDCFTSSIQSDMCATSSSIEHKKTRVCAHSKSVSYGTKEKEKEPSSCDHYYGNYKQASNVTRADLMSMVVLWLANVMSLLEFMPDAIVAKWTKSNETKWKTTEIKAHTIPRKIQRPMCLVIPCLNRLKHSEYFITTHNFMCILNSHND